jgi:hypothetical protein
VLVFFGGIRDRVVCRERRECCAYRRARNRTVSTRGEPLGFAAVCQSCSISFALVRQYISGSLFLFLTVLSLCQCVSLCAILCARLLRSNRHHALALPAWPKLPYASGDFVNTVKVWCTGHVPRRTRGVPTQRNTPSIRDLDSSMHCWRRTRRCRQYARRMPRLLWHFRAEHSHALTH